MRKVFKKGFISFLMTIASLMLIEFKSEQVAHADQWLDIKDDTRITLHDDQAHTPSLVIDSDGNLHVLWADHRPNRDGAPEIFYKKLDNNGDPLVPDKKITFLNNHALRSPSIGIDNQDHIHLAWNDGRTGNNEIYYTKLDKNGNRLPGFENDIRISNLLDGSINPQLRVDRFDNIHIAWDDQDEGGTKEIYYTKLDNNGNTLVDDVRLTNDPARSQFPVLALDNSYNIHIAWTDDRNGKREVFYTKFRINASNTVESIVGNKRLVFDNDSQTQDMTADASGNLHILYRNNANSDYAKLDNDGNIIVQHKIANSGPAITYDYRLLIDSAGDVHATWVDTRDGGDEEVYFTKFEVDAVTNILTTIVPETRLTNAVGLSNHQSFKIDGAGDIHMVWGDTRDNPTVPGGLASIYYTKGRVNRSPIANAGPDQTEHVGTAVTLDGSASHDPDENYPLTFSWEIVSYPGGSPPALSGADTPNPTFTPDLVGDYVIELIVTDSLGLSSTPDTVTVSTFNTAPTADAGPDQVIIQTGTIVNLNGTQSYDLDGDNFTYEWTLLTRPTGSVAALDDPTSPTPTFVADVHGNYEVRLVVTDIFGAVSDPDTVLVSFENVPPVADPGDNQAISVGSSVYLDGSGSSDANLDSLTYSWSFVSMPGGSGAVLSDPNLPQTTFVADVAGIYIVSLTVSDGFGGSDTANVTVVASTVQDELVQTLQNLITVINGFDPGVFKNRNMQNSLTNKINAILGQIDQGLYQEALDKLENDILDKTDGCAMTGAPDRNDWILTCTEQNQIYPLIIYAIDLLNSLI